MKKKVFPTLLILFFIAGLFTATPALSAPEKSGQTLRVGFPIQSGLTEIDQNGNYTGYTYEYLEEISQYTGWNYEFVQIPGNIDESLTTMLGMLETGELDLMGALVYNDSTTQRFDFAGQSYGSAYTVLNVLYEDTTVTKNNYLSFKPLRVAAMKSSNNRMKELNQFCEMNNLQYEIVPCETEEEQKQALRDKRADVMLAIDLNISSDLRSIAKFSPRPYYFATTKGNDEIVQKINAAILSIEEADPYFSTKLYETYFNPQEKSLILSDNDQQFIRQSDVLKVGVLLDNPPFHSKNSQTGELEGISLDLLQLVSEATGLNFEMVPVHSQQELEQMIGNNEIDLVSSAIYDYQQARKQGIALTRPYVSSQYIMLVNKDANDESLDGKSLALPNQIEYQGFTSENILWYNDLQACIEAVNSGEADYTYGNGYAVQYYMNNPEYRNLRSIPQASSSYQLSIGVVQKGNNTLLSILNKAIISLPDGDLQSVIYQNTITPQKYSLSTLIKSNPAVFLLIIAALAVFIIGVLLWVLHTRNRVSKKNAMDLKKHYQLYALSNEQFFEYNCVKKSFEVFLDKSSAPDDLHGPASLSGPSESWNNLARQKPFLDVIESGGDGIRDAHCSMPDGSQKWLRISYRTISDDAGKPAYVIGKLSDIDEEMQEKEKLLNQAQKDSLTQLYNAAACRNLITEKLAELKPDAMGALFILDVDHFKTINDIYGHYTGDKVLAETAQVLRTVFRKKDIVGRLGGDEFIIYLTDLTKEKVLTEKCTTLCQKVGNIELPDDQTALSVSIGVAVARPQLSFDTLYQQADEMLYRVKRKGRNGFAVVDPENSSDPVLHKEDSAI